MSNRQLEVRLPRATVFYMNLSSFGGAAVTVALLWGLEATVIPDGWSPWLAISGSAFILLTALIDTAILNVRERRFFRLTITYETVLLHRGRVIETDAAMLRSAIVSVDVVSNPLLKALGLARLTLQGIGRFPEIPPLGVAEAYEIQAFLTQTEHALSAVSGET